MTAGFPVAVLTWSGVASVNAAYYDVARTLGANQRFLIFKVAIPAALPQVFVGLFMGLGASFAVLVTAEMMGVKAGPRLLSAMGAGLGRVCEYVCGAAGHGADVLRAHYASLQSPRPRPFLSEGRREVVAALAYEQKAAASRPLHIRDVSHSFWLEGKPLPVLQDITFRVDPGQFVALLGPSGCGKSTLLRLVAGLDKPLQGEIRTGDAPVEGPDPSRVVVFQDPTLYPWRRVWDNVALGLEAQGLLKTRTAARR